MFKFLKITVSALALGLALSTAHAADDPFPLRKEAKYADLKFINIDEFEKEKGGAVVIDVRSQFEYDTIHIDGAKNVSINLMNFAAKVEELRKKKDPNKKILLYCNGAACTQSPDAGLALKTAGFDNFYVFDGGVGAFARKHPENTQFMGKPLGDASKLHAPTKLTERQVAYDKIVGEQGNKNAVLIDVRENFFRKKVPDLKGLIHLPLSRIVPLLQAGKYKDKTVYFMDDSGHRLQWLQYHIEKYGYTNYHLLKGGLNAALQ